MQTPRSAPTYRNLAYMPVWTTLIETDMARVLSVSILLVVA